MWSKSKPLQDGCEKKPTLETREFFMLCNDAATPTIKTNIAFNGTYKTNRAQA
jgi:hypothetical protein